MFKVHPLPPGAPDTLLGTEALEDIMDFASKSPPGCFVEFGVYKGGSAFHLARVAVAQGRELHLYDTFEGIPFRGEFDQHDVGDFSDTSYEAVSAAVPYAQIHKGLFPDSLVPMPPIAFAHIDCDQYESVKAALRHFGPRMVPGGVMLFDDYHCLPSATKAVREEGREFTTTSNNKAVMRF
jgi:hypothetical protein